MKLVRKILVAMLLGTMAIQVVWADINEDFIKVAYQCDLDKVKQLLRLGADVNVDNGRAFIKAHSCSSKAIKIMEYLISQGLDINTKRNNRTVLDDTLVMNLYFATDYNLIKYLVYKGANVNVRVSESENTLLNKMLYSSPDKNIDIIEYVLSKGAIVGTYDLNRFVKVFEYKMSEKKMSAKEWAILKLAIKNTKNLDYCSDMHHNIGLYNYTYKAVKDKVDDLLLQNGLDIKHQCESSGYTRLMDAVYSLDKVKYLISKGADVNIKDKNGETTLTKALNAKKYDTAEFLISKGAKK